ncbi:MAG: hypothetical protein K8W52_14810 [Deltaproteobacteria bacterium]|nr:hypothetical protein [Deltaproteobacteria bacterium]
MRRLVVVGVLACVALGGCKRVRERLAARGSATGSAVTDDGSAAEPPPRPPAPLPSGPGLAPGQYRLAEVQVTALPTKATGLPWDAGASYREPDLSVTVTLDGVPVDDCRIAGDALGGSCELDKVVTIGPDAVLALRVIDRDLSADDPVGDAELGQPSRWGVDMALPMQPSGQVATASIILAPGPSWWDRNGTLFMLIAGLGGGLAIWIVIRQISHRAEVQAIRRAEEAKLRACAHCATRIAIRDARCSHCGAPQPPIEDAA